MRNLTLAFLAGLMIGSLSKTWPWKQTLTWQAGSYGKPVAILQENLLPTDFAVVSGQGPQLLLAIVLAPSGVGLWPSNQGSSKCQSHVIGKGMRG